MQNDQNRFRALGKEYAQLEPVVQCFRQYQSVLDDQEYAQSLLQDGDPDVRAMARDELEEFKDRQEQLEKDLQILLLPKDPNDDKNTYLEIRAAPAAPKPPCSPPTCTACTCAMPSGAAGRPS